MSPRTILALLLACHFPEAIATASAQPAPAVAGPEAPQSDFTREIAALEKQHGGRLGVSVLEVKSGKRLAHRGGERFAICSTFKMPLAAAVAAKVDAGQESWERRISYGEKDLLSYAPVAARPENLKAGMTVESLCAAAMEYSDNTAANLLLDVIGGPEAMTRYLRSIGDGTTRLDRTEPDLNTNLPGDERDTTTPDAMVATLDKLLLGDALSPASRARLTAWMVANKTGDKRLRAGMNPSWKTGDRTGTGENGAANDIAIVWPREAHPVLIAVYYTGSAAAPEERDKVISRVGRIVSEALFPE